ncbi:MAG: hypothetical protein HYS13_10085 [Planctomycetia bacterium]|nr:hypothetical protein [Planctomycetia bacterium]
MAYALSLVPIVAGVGLTGVLTANSGAEAPQSVFARLSNFDGRAYCDIAAFGYAPPARSGALSNLAFFPAFPVLGRALALCLWLPAEAALVIVAHLCCWGAVVAGGAYARARCPDSADAPSLTAMALALLPTTFFFRMAYSESMFAVLTGTILLGFHRRWPTVVLALLVGLATATRFVGLALVPPLLLYCWHSGRRSEIAGCSLHSAGEARRRVAACLAGFVLYASIACWGLLAFSAFQWIRFGDPLIFAKVQYDWGTLGEEPAPLIRRIVATATLEPIWGTYVPSNPAYWARFEPHGNPLFSLQFANPIYFVGTVLLIVFGWRKGLLNRYELLTAAGLLLIPYVTKSYDNAMAGFGRFAAVVVPAYLVMGWLLARMPPVVRYSLLGVAGFFLGIYSAMFAAGYRFI